MTAERADTFSDAHQAELAAIIGFAPGDLAANRRGMLTARQVALLRRDVRRRTWPAAIVAGLLAAVVVVLAVIAAAGVTERILAAGGASLLALYAAAEARAALAPIGTEPGQVKACSWVVGERWTPARRLGVIEFQVDSQWFSADRALADCLRKRWRYRLYYYAPEWSFSGAAVGTRRWNAISIRPRYGGYRILSIEPVGRSE